MAEYTIKHRYTGAVLYSGGGESLRDVVEAAVRARTNLARANLTEADLTGANLTEANLAGACLSRANLIDANLSRANLTGAKLTGASLIDANLAGAYLFRAYLSRANLTGADLTGANLTGANLTEANLAGACLSMANLTGANLAEAALVGVRPIIQIGPIGSRCAYLVAYLTNAGVQMRAGCFSGSLETFRAAVVKTHGDNEHGREYAAAIAMIEAHAEIWAPADVARAA